MPELPEVETIRRGIAPYMVDCSIVGSVVRQPQLRWPVAEQIYQLQGRVVLSVQRRGKYLLIQLDSGWILIHLGMSGSLRIVRFETPVEQHDHIDILLSNHYILRFTDPRRFGFWLWRIDPQQDPLLAKLGKEPLEESFNGAYLHCAARGRRGLLKPWLMEGRVVAGIGNIYANEALYRIGLSPIYRISALDLQQADRLATALQEMLLEAIEQGGSSIRDFKGADGRLGYFAQRLQVYGRAGKGCYRCHTLIETFKQAQRSTFYCPCCQTVDGGVLNGGTLA